MFYQRTHLNTLAAMFLSLTVYFPAAHSGDSERPDFLAPSLVFTDTEIFIDTTGAEDLTGPLPEVDRLSRRQAVGAVTFQAPSPSLLVFGDFVPDSEDPVQMLVEGKDQLHIIPNTPKFSLGIELEEVSRFNPNADGPLRLSIFAVTLCEVTFASDAQCPEPAIIDQLEFLGRFRDLGGGPSPIVGVWSHRPIAQMSLEEISEGDASEFFARVYGGDRPRPKPAVDRFEGDDSPDTASVLGDDGFGGITFAQTHSFHGADVEDWIFYQGNVKQFELRVLGDEPEFHGVVEMHGIDRLLDPSVEPIQILGSCDAPAQSLVFNGAYPAGVQLFRVVNCQPQPPVRYEFILKVLEFDNGVVLGLGAGEVIDETTGNPASVVIVTNFGQLVFSSPRNGGFRFAAVQGEELILNVISPEFDADPIVVPAVGPFEIPEPVTLFVRQVDGLLTNGFEN
ncbi:MAG: hypothetical protein AB8B96_12605 [Lysobacterales bacterium]